MSFESLSLRPPLQGMVERSFLPSAIFLIFKRNRPLKVWRTRLQAVFHWNVKGKLEIKAKEQTVWGVLWRWRTGAIDRTASHSCRRCQFFKFLILKTRWCDEVTWLRSTIFLNDQEYFERNVLGKFHIRTRCWRCVNNGFRKYLISHMETSYSFALLCSLWTPVLWPVTSLGMRAKVLSVGKRDQGGLEND